MSLAILSPSVISNHPCSLELPSHLKAINKASDTGLPQLWKPCPSKEGWHMWNVDIIEPAKNHLLQGSTSTSICSPDVQNPPTIKPNSWSKSLHFNMFEASRNLPTSQPSHANPWVDSFVPSPVWPRSGRKTPPTLWRCPSRALPPSCCKGRSRQILPDRGCDGAAMGSYWLVHPKICKLQFAVDGWWWYVGTEVG